MTSEMLRERGVYLLWLTLGIGLLLRLWGIWYGLPFSYWIDEYHEVMRALELGAGSFNLNRTSKGGFYYLLFFEYGLYYLYLKVAGVVATPQEFAEQFVRDPSAFYLMGRATAALLGAATIAAVFLLARKSYSRTAGLLAALFIAINLLHTDLSRRIGVDIPMAMFATLALYFGLRLAQGGRRSDYLLAALFAALAATTKLPGVLVLLPLFIAHVYAVRESRPGFVKIFATRELWMAVALFAVVLVISNPGIVAQSGYLTHFSEQTAAVDHDSTAEAIEPTGQRDRPNLYLYYLNEMRASMGWPLFALSALALAFAAWKRTTADVVLLSYAICNFVVISSTSSDTLYYPRYALPIVLVLAILAGRMLADLFAAFPARRIPKILLIALLVATPLIQSAGMAFALSQTDTRTLARQWFDENVPAGGRVLIEGGKIAPLRTTVPLEDSQESLQRRIAYWTQEEPRQARFLELKQKVHAGGGYDLELTDVESIEDLETYVGRGIVHFVVRPDYFIKSRRSRTASARLVYDLRASSSVELVRRYVGESRGQLGPTIEIYRVNTRDTAQSAR